MTDAAGLDEAPQRWWLPQSRREASMFLVTTYRMKPDLSGVQTGRMLKGYKDLRIPHDPINDNPLYEPPLKTLAPPSTTQYRTEDGAHGAIIINTDRPGSNEADAVAGLEWLAEVKRRYDRWLDFDDTHDMHQMDDGL